MAAAGEAVRTLLNAGANADATTASGESALHIAAGIREGTVDESVIEELSVRCTELNRRHRGRTALCRAIVSRQFVCALSFMDYAIGDHVYTFSRLMNMNKHTSARTCTLIGA